MRGPLKEYLERLPAPFAMLEVEARVKDQSPYVVVALQEVRAQARSAAEGRRRRCAAAC